jgi:hypothetical protein
MIDRLRNYFTFEQEVPGLYLTGTFPYHMEFLLARIRRDLASFKIKVANMFGRLRSHPFVRAHLKNIGMIVFYSIVTSFVFKIMRFFFFRL